MQIRLEDGMTIDEAAIKLIQAYEPPEGYYLGFSGGKDSVVINHLAERARVKFTPVYNVSPIDPPQIYQFIKEHYPQVVWENNAKNFWNEHFMRNGLPSPRVRWCCRIIKESGGIGKTKILGMRKSESNKRSKYECFNARPKNTFHLLPILLWTDADIWQYIYENQLEVCSLYKNGFTRIGCILCPFEGKDKVKLSIQMFPKTIQNYKNACNRYITERNSNPKRKPTAFKTGEEYFNWWIKR